MRQLFGIRAIQRLTEFATVDFGLWPHEPFDVLGVVVPTFQMTGTELAFGVLFVTGALPVFSNLYLRQRRCSLLGDRCRGRGCLRARRDFLHCVECIAHGMLISPGGVLV